MPRPIWLRLCLAACLLAPAAVILGLVWRAEAQPGGPQFEKIWKCGKCGGNLGNGVNPPSTCPRCGAKLASPRTTDWPGSAPTNSPSRPSSNSSANDADSGWTAGKIIAILIAGLAVVGLGVFVMKDSGPV